jgi:hypothetical protein
VTDSALINANQHRRTSYDNVIRMLGGKPHSLFPASNAAKISFTQMTKTQSALRARGWQQSFPSLKSDTQRREELIIELDTLKIAHQEVNKAAYKVYQD